LPPPPADDPATEVADDAEDPDAEPVEDAVVEAVVPLDVDLLELLQAVANPRQSTVLAANIFHDRTFISFPPFPPKRHMFDHCCLMLG
jgi:hypothetical protein